MRGVWSGGRLVLGISLSVGLLAASACNYSFRSGSFPNHIRTVAILPFDNETTRFELTQEIHEQLLRDLPRALGITNAGEEVADAIVRGTITRYTLSTPLFRPGAQQDRIDVLQRQVSVSIRVEFVDVANNEILWENVNLSVQGQYLEETESEDDGRAEAIELLVQRIVDGAQSNW